MATYGLSGWKQFRTEISARPIGLPVMKWIMIVVAGLWIAGAGWTQIPGYTAGYGVGSTAYRKATRSCSGSFSSRYECKSGALISGENQVFIDWSVRLAIVFIPVIGLGIVYGFLRRRREERDAEEARRRLRARRRPAP